MAYDEVLADRVRDLLEGQSGVREQAMFGGLGFLVDGNMAVAASSSGDLMVRVDPEVGEDLVDGVVVRPMVMRGRVMRGWLLVSVDAVAADADLRDWVDRGVGFARSLPPKAGGSR